MQDKMCMIVLVGSRDMLVWLRSCANVLLLSCGHMLWDPAPRRPMLKATAGTLLQTVQRRNA